MAPAVKRDERKSKYPGMQNVVINVFSGFCIVLGLASIGVQVKWCQQHLHQIDSLIFIFNKLTNDDNDISDCCFGHLCYRILLQLRLVCRRRRRPRNLGWFVLRHRWQFIGIAAAYKRTTSL
jgi:hypothetical protein